MQIVIFPYILYSRGSLNAVSQRREFHGALIKVDDGIGCLHPWPEFGDAPVDEQLALLREGGTSQVIERALQMAAVDGEARKRGVSLFAGLEIPPSHYSWDQHQPPEPQMQRVIGEGWKAIKGKGTQNIDEVLRWCEERSADFSPQSVDLSRTKVRAPFIRLDFNSCLTEELCRRFMERMLPQVSQCIDFIEDPFPYGAAAWTEAQNEFGISLACDKGLSVAFHKETAHSFAVHESGQECPGSLPDKCGYDFAVLKPGRRDWRKVINSIPGKARIVMTSAMDHAIGQSFAAYEAALAWRELGDRIDLCGLCTEHLFTGDEFFERISSHGGNLQVDRNGTGLGFDETLAELPWKEL